MAAPARAPPDNLLFRGPPPTLPCVLLLPADSGPAQTQAQHSLHQINNVGVPTPHLTFDDQVGNQVLKTENSDDLLPSENYLRRTNSFDITDIYTPNYDIDIDLQAFRHRRSEPDLSRYGLFVEAEVSVDCAPLEQPQLVLNNPFYDGSYAVDPAQLNPTLVMLPENYLAFEDAFAPTWGYKPEYLIDRDLNTGLYYDGLPLIPANDPWSSYCGENSAYCSDNNGFQYYSPHYETPINQDGINYMPLTDGINYMPLTDLDYTIPTYMSLPEEVEEAQIENRNADSSSLTSPNLNIDSENSENIKSNETSNVSVVVSNLVSCVIESPMVKESSTHSEESLNADISNDITSSMAFVPDSKSLQMPGVDDTSADTSPCSTDYQEASALDLVQSLDELSCCDSSDFSQSREELSPALPPNLPEIKAESPSEVAEEEEKEKIINNVTNYSICKVASNLPLSDLPSIPIPDNLPPTLPPLVNKTETTTALVEKKEDSQVSVGQLSQTNTVPLEVSNILEVPENQVNETIETKSPQTEPHPHPPAVPPSWLPRKPPTSDKPPTATTDRPTSAVPPPIRTQRVETRPVFEKSQKPPSQVKGIPPQISGEPQPSCSFTLSQAAPATQLKVEKQPKEVEVSQ